MIRDAFIILRKELKNLFKDRRTLILIVGLPLVIMPLIFGTIGAVTASQQRRAVQTVYRVWIRGNDDPVFRTVLAELLQFDAVQAADEDTLVVEFPQGYVPGHPATVQVYFDSTSTRSTYAAARIESALDRYAERFSEARLRAVGLSPEDLRTLRVERVDQAPEQARDAGILPMLLPYLIVIYLFSGSMNVGLDCTAGERERGSLALVLVNQVSRTSIALGKVLYVVCAALINSVASFTGIVLALRYLGSRVAEAGISPSFAIFTPASILGLLLTLASLGMFAAAVIVMLGSLAKTVREGGTYILPIYLIAIVVGVASMQADASREPALFLIPLVNAVFVLKEILLAQSSLAHLAITVGVNVAAAAILVRLVARLYNSERILDTV
jgi:sodium transport system permease protein